MRRILHHITVSPIFGLQGKSCTEPAEIYIYIHIQIHAQIYKYAHIFIILFLKSCHASYTSNWNILEKKDASLCTSFFVSHSCVSVLPLSLYSVYTVVCICTALCIFSLLYNEFLMRNASLLSVFFVLVNRYGQFRSLGSVRFQQEFDQRLW